MQCCLLQLQLLLLLLLLLLGPLLLRLEMQRHPGRARPGVSGGEGLVACAAG